MPTGYKLKKSLPKKKKSALKIKQTNIAKFGKGKTVFSISKTKRTRIKRKG